MWATYTALHPCILLTLKVLHGAGVECRAFLRSKKTSLRRAKLKSHLRFPFLARGVLFSRPRYRLRHRCKLSAKLLTPLTLDYIFLSEISIADIYFVPSFSFLYCIFVVILSPEPK